MTDPHQPLRLARAAALAFPDGTMTVSALRKEAARGRLIIERIAGKDYTTLANIIAMRQLCQLSPKGRGYTCEGIEPAVGMSGPSGMSLTVDDMNKAQDAARAIVEGLSRR